MPTPLDELSRLLEHFEARKERAKNRLAQSNGSYWYFGIIGLTPPATEYVFPEVARFRAVVEPPGELELASALSNNQLSSAVGRYSGDIGCELAVIRRGDGDDDFTFKLGWHMIAAIRVRSQAEFLVPAAADYSWSTIAGIPNGKCTARLVEDVPMAMRLGEPAAVNISDLDWVATNLVKFVEMSRFPAFSTACEAITSYNHQTNRRLMVASLWAGIESLFAISQELRYQVAAFTASVLEPRGAARLGLYNKV